MNVFLFRLLTSNYLGYCLFYASRSKIATALNLINPLELGYMHLLMKLMQCFLFH